MRATSSLGASDGVVPPTGHGEVVLVMLGARFANGPPFSAAWLMSSAGVMTAPAGDIGQSYWCGCHTCIICNRHDRYQ